MREPAIVGGGLPGRTALIDTRAGVVPYCRLCRWGGTAQRPDAARAALHNHATSRRHRRRVLHEQIGTPR
jgi:hypothetical protein